MNYLSTKRIASSVCPGVHFTIRCMSFGRRIELMQRVRDASRSLEFHGAGDGMLDRLEAALASVTIESLYVSWGLESIEGLSVDDESVTAASLLSRGPELLCREIAGEIRRECGLTEEERKN